MGIRDRPLLTDVYQYVDDFTPINNSVYIYAPYGEQRNVHSKEWEQKAVGVEFLSIAEQSPMYFDIVRAGKESRYELRSRDQLTNFWSSIGNCLVYIDITGMDHHVWAPLIKSGLDSGIPIKCVYVEPLDYIQSTAPAPGGEIYDLSEKIKGIQLLPGFISLSQVREENIRFIPLLGFEGPRLSYIINKIDPFREKIIPIVGTPGFRAEHPFHTIYGNQKALLEEEGKPWKNIHYAIANCPFSLFYLLEDLANKYPDDLLKIAPIGTKPHALGAILFAIASIGSTHLVELLYDYPIRRKGRSKGTARLLVYDVSTFMA